MGKDPYVCDRTKCRYNQGPECKDGSCNYLLVEGRSRIAQHEPGHRSPKECKCYKGGPRVKARPEPLPVTAKTEPKRLIPYHSRPALDWEIAYRLYREGMSDGEIAAQIGCSRDSVRKWRKRNDLPTKQRAGRGSHLISPCGTASPQGEAEGSGE